MENSYQVSLLYYITLNMIRKQLFIIFIIDYITEADEDEKRSENFEKNFVSTFLYIIILRNVKLNYLFLVYK